MKLTYITFASFSNVRIKLNSQTHAHHYFRTLRKILLKYLIHKLVKQLNFSFKPSMRDKSKTALCKKKSYIGSLWMSCLTKKHNFHTLIFIPYIYLSYNRYYKYIYIRYLYIITPPPDTNFELLIFN